MLVTCICGKKKFNVPDSAITDSGRLLQCGACGEKWTQFPFKQEPINTIKKTEKSIEIPKTKPSKVNVPPKINKTKTLIKKKKREIQLYSEEYLNKKYGLEIKHSFNDKKIKKSEKHFSGSFFFSYLITTVVFVTAFFGILNMTKDFVILSYPFTEIYINFLYEVIEIIKVAISNLIN